MSIRSKSAVNKEKHGIDFEEAQALWDDPWAITAYAQSDIEPRFLVIGRIHEVFWTQSSHIEAMSSELFLYADLAK